MTMPLKQQRPALRAPRHKNALAVAKIAHWVWDTAGAVQRAVLLLPILLRHRQYPERCVLRSMRPRRPAQICACEAREVRGENEMNGGDDEKLMVLDGFWGSRRRQRRADIVVVPSCAHAVFPGSCGERRRRTVPQRGRGRRLGQVWAENMGREVLAGLQEKAG